MEVLEHILPSKIFIALNEIKRVLKGNGELIMSVPLNEGLEELIKRGVNPNGHVRIYTPELVFAELKISGFRVQKRKLLYAFRNLYTLKKTLQNTIMKKRWKPNNLIIFARK